MLGRHRRRRPETGASAPPPPGGDAITLYLTLPITITPRGDLRNPGFDAGTPALNCLGRGPTPRAAVLDMLRYNSYDSPDDSRGLYFPNRETLETLVDDLLATHARKTEWTIRGHIHPAPFSVAVTTTRPLPKDHWAERLTQLGAR